jgi:hypothetical protein
VLRDLVKNDEKNFKSYQKNWKCYIKPTIKHYRQILDTSFSSASTAYSGSGVVEPREFRFLVETRKKGCFVFDRDTEPLAVVALNRTDRSYMAEGNWRLLKSGEKIQLVVEASSQCKSNNLSYLP